MEEFLKNQEKLSKERIDKLMDEVRALNQRIDAASMESFNTTQPPQQTGFNSSLDSIHCCGRDVDIEATQPFSESPENNRLLNVGVVGIDRIINNLPEEHKDVFIQTMKELDKFQATLSEKDLARLERKTEELKRK